MPLNIYCSKCRKFICRIIPVGNTKFLIIWHDNIKELLPTSKLEIILFSILKYCPHCKKKISKIEEVHLNGRLVYPRIRKSN